jgi:putative ATPase
MDTTVPLAVRVRPQTLEAFVGQQHLLAKDKMLYRAIKADRVSSAIFWGPAGTGKTTLAGIIANKTQRPVAKLSAVTAGVKDIRQVVAMAEKQGRALLLLDEIHRFNKSQQDMLLPYIENGLLVIVGSTTENPYFEINGALRSRATLYQFQPLTREEVQLILKRALTDPEKGLGRYQVTVAQEALHFLSDVCGGDVRVALNALELAVLTTEPDLQDVIRLTVPVLEACVQRRMLRYDKNGDAHYHVASALIKSIRGSDPDAALHYLARALSAGESVEFIARRLVISAAEDIGLAQPQALVIANAAAQAAHFVGMPEARIILAEAAIYLALCPKSNSAYLAVEQALTDIQEKDTGPVPVHLRDISYVGAKRLGHGRGYCYPHNYPGAYVPQQYLPDPLVGVSYYHPNDRGVELRLKQRWKQLQLLKKR